METVHDTDQRWTCSEWLQKTRGYTRVSIGMMESVLGKKRVKNAAFRYEVSIQSQRPGDVVMVKVPDGVRHAGKGGLIGDRSSGASRSSPLRSALLRVTSTWETV